MRQRLIALRHEADALGIPYRELLDNLRGAGVLARDPNGRGHTVRRGWADKLRDRRFHSAIQTDDGRLFYREISVVYCTRKGQRWLPKFVARRKPLAPRANSRFDPSADA